MQQRSDRIHSAGFPDNNPVIAHAAPVWTPLPHSVLHRERRSIRVRYSTHTARMLSHINTRGGPVPVHSSPCTIWNDMHAITFTWIHSESLLCSRGYLPAPPHPPPHQSDTPTQLLADANARLLMSVGNAEEVSLKGRVTQIYKTHFRTCTWDHRDVSAVRRIQRCL